MRCGPAAVLVLALLAAGSRASAIEWGSEKGPSLSLHGYGEVQLRSYARGFDTNDWVPSQWANVLDLEAEADVAPNGFGPFDSISAFARVEVRYDCVYTGCGIEPSWRWFGDNANRAPRNLADGRTNPYTGTQPVKSAYRIQRDDELVDFFVIPPFDTIRKLGGTNIDATFAPISDALFSVKKIGAPVGTGTFALGPWRPDVTIHPEGSLQTVVDPTTPLPLRPAVPAPHLGGHDAHGLFVPSYAYEQRRGGFDDFGQNFSQKDLEWNHGESQDEGELRELYMDLEMFDGRLWIRGGKQDIVWGKTELFRTTDQFNPQDLALSSLPSLEESRIPLWSVRGVWSFYDVGPLEDVRLEMAANLDDFQPLDFGRCGEPYAVWLVCGKTFGLWAHGFSGAGIAGEEKPPMPWNDIQALEWGARLEWRYGRFSFQLSDFWGYDDAPVIDSFAEYSRNVDPLTGKPLDALGQPLVPGEPADQVLARSPTNRQLFDVVCSATVGVAGATISALAQDCLVDLPNSQAPLALGLTPALAISQMLGGSGGTGLNGESILQLITGLAGHPTSATLVELNHDPNDGPGTPEPFPSSAATSLSSYLTDQQEALLGCGPFYGTNCDTQGIDLLNAEASVLLQSFPQFEPGGPVATRPVGPLPAVLPGARGPQDDINHNGVPDTVDPAIPVVLRYSPLVDGCTAPAPGACSGAHALIDPRTGKTFPNEMAALSYNFMVVLAALGSATGKDPKCDVANPITCDFVNGIFDVSGERRPEVRAGGNGTYGRRDFVWQGGSEIAVRYKRRNVLGLAFDFAEDHTKTDWSVEATWFHDQPYAVLDQPHGFSLNDTFNLTVSIDRPTFVNFLNANRTFFINTQWFVRYIAGYRQGEYVTHGPWSLLGTLSIVTGYYQDRLLPAFTWVHDVRSTSGGVIGQVSFRFTENFSGTVGIANFYGSPGTIPLALRQPLLVNAAGNYDTKNRYDGLTPIAERDEVFILLRYTF
jgi:hypothetical protein